MENELETSVPVEETPAERTETGRRLDRRPRKKRHRWRIPIILLAALLVLAVGAVLAAYGGILPVDPGILPDPNAKTGALYAMDPDAEVAAGTYRYILNQQPTMAAGERNCNLNLENVAGNHYAVQATLTTPEGEELWSSFRVRPGKYVENAKLSRAFEPGEYPLNVNYRFLEGNTEIGAQTIGVTLYVK